MFKVLFTVEPVENIKDDLEEGRFTNLKFFVKLSSNNNESTNKHSEGDSEFLKLTDHFVDHHDQFSKFASSLEQQNHDQRV